MNSIHIVKCNYIFIYVTLSSSVYYRLQTSGRRKIVWFVKTGSEKDTYKVGRNDIVLFEIFISILGAKLVNYKCFSFLKIKENISPPIQGLEKLFFLTKTLLNLCVNQLLKRRFQCRLCLRIYFSKKGDGSE